MVVMVGKELGHVGGLVFDYQADCDIFLIIGRW